MLLLHDVLGVAASQGQASGIIEIGALRALALAAPAPATWPRSCAPAARQAPRRHRGEPRPRRRA